MPKKSKITSVKTAKIDFQKKVMSQVSSGKIKMKPKWYFVFVSILMIVGLTGVITAAIFFINLNLFLIRRHGPMLQWRLDLMLNNFPLWIPLLAILAVVAGIWLLKKFDFSYKTNFVFLIISFIIALFASGWFINALGLNEIWSQTRPMRRFYQRLELNDGQFVPGQGRFRQLDRPTGTDQHFFLQP
jgi:hypothetical protein